MSDYERLLNATGRLLEHPAFADLPSSAPTTARHHLPPVSLVLPHVNTSLQKELEHLGWKRQTIVALEGVLEDAFSRLEAESRRALDTILGHLRAWNYTEDEHWFSEYSSSVAVAVGKDFEREANVIRDEVLKQAISAANRQSCRTEPVCDTSHDRFYPLPEPKVEPNGAFTEEVIEILRRAFEKCETLTRGEVKGLQSITKLNSKQIRTWFANQRQRRGRKPAPYLPPRRAPASQTPTKPFRNVSNSSTSSSLISYSSTSSDKPHFELQGSPDAFSSLDSDHPPPVDSRMDVEDVPMPQLNSTSPTIEYPRSLSIPAETGPFPISSIPPAPTTAETDRFFSSQQFASPLPPRSNEIYDVEYLPAQMSSTMNSDFLDQLQRTDPFLDDEFLKNVFGTLGVTQGGGLTLTMDSFQDEGEMSSGSGGSEGRGGSQEGQGGLMMEFARGGGAGVGGPAGGFAFGW